MISLYNTLTRKQEDFHPIKPGYVGVYSCGPTVYWFAHIGNMRAFLFADVLRRMLQANGLHVKSVMNITDVGHLTDDADEGEDKMLVAMQREGKSALEISEFYTQAFFDDLDRLNIQRAEAYPKATEHIEEQIEIIQTLEDRGYTYQTSDGVYFDTSKLPEYGRLSGQKAEEKQAGARVEMGEKRNATDFALWKFSPKDKKREMEWESPWGVGFPGWHIECSVMSKKFLGVPFDIHTGGIDHIAVHHENELAQTQGAEDTLEANYWMHNEFITVDGGKMSKSIGNVYTISDLMEKGFDPLAFRYLCLQAHYRSKLNFTFESLGAAQNALSKIKQAVRSWDMEAKEGGFEFEQKFMEAINDDLNTPKALAVLWQLLDADLSEAEKKYVVQKMDAVFGLNLVQEMGKKEDMPEEIMVLVHAREEARQAKDWTASDQFRDELLQKGYVVEDGAEGTRVRKIS